MNDFHSLCPFNIGSADAKDKFMIPLNAEHLGYVQKFVRITEAGKKFLEENKQQ
jgi:hypothetical protein